MNFFCRSYSYAGTALLRALHNVRYFSGVVECSKSGEKKQLKLIEVELIIQSTFFH